MKAHSAYQVLVDDLNSVQILLVAELGQDDCAKAAIAHAPDDVKV